MTGQEIKKEFALQSALRDAFWLYGMRLLPGKEEDLLAHLRGLGVEADLSAGYLVLTQQGTQLVLSQMAETIRKQHAEWFNADPRRDAVSCREDLERGTAAEIATAKAKYIGQHGIASWEALPKTRAEAMRKSATPTASMSKAEYLALPFAERSKLAGIIGASGIARIMARK